MTRARVAAQALRLLGPVDGPLVVVGTGGRPGGVRTAGDAEPAAGALCTFLGEAADPAARRTRLALLATRLAPGTPLVVVDHNQPRAFWRRAVGWGVLALRGFGPSRARYPVAREVQDHGFTIERMRFAQGERVQLLAARRR